MQLRQEPEDRVAAVMAAHGRTLLHVAHRWSLCHDDALDAYQRALEIFLRRAESVDPATEVAWLKVVVKHESLAIRRARSEVAGADEPDLDTRAASSDRSVDEVIASGERVSRSAEALRALKPDEARALLLKAEGLSYVEIAERFGWTYTKVNRALTEGRRRFLRVYAAIESGDACKAYAPVLAALAAGTASSADVLAVRPHLRHCTACRATVRELHLSAVRRVRLFVPALVLAPFRALVERGGPHAPAAAVSRPSASVLLEGPPAGRGGGPGLRLATVREHLLSLVERMGGPDAATGLAVVTGGGGRVATIATVLGFCASSLGAGALCVATGVVSAPRWLSHRSPAATRPHPIRHRAAAPVIHAAATVAPTPNPAATPRPTPTATSTATPRLAASHRPASRRAVARRASPSTTADPSQGSGPTAHEASPISPAVQSAPAEFSPETTTSAPTTTSPAPASNTGGEEFTP